MAHLVRIKTMQEYRNVVDVVLRHGKPRSPRGEATLDAGQVTVVLEDPTYALAQGVGRGLSPRVAAVEALQLIGGFHHPEMMVWASPAFKQFMDGETFHGAYGTRVGHQVELAVGKLEEDPDTRQAVVTLWDPAKDNDAGLHDYPCTVAFGFSVRRLDTHDVLDMHVTMRSNDVWLGFPYDVFQFTQLQQSVARTLGMPVGEYTHTAWSMHLYEKHRQLAEALPAPGDALTVYQPKGIGWGPGASFRGIMRDAQALAVGQLHRKLGSFGNSHRVLTESEEWYRGVLSAYTSELG